MAARPTPAAGDGRRLPVQGSSRTQSLVPVLEPQLPEPETTTGCDRVGEPLEGWQRFLLLRHVVLAAVGPAKTTEHEAFPGTAAPVQDFNLD